MTTPKATDPMTLSPAMQSPPSTSGARRIAKLGVVGAGAMGAGIAALAASANVPVVLLDIPGDEKDRNAPAKGGLDRVKKSKPAAFMDPAKAALIRTGNTEDHLDWLADCDWIVEAIIEQPGPKQQLFARLEKLMKPGAIVTSNTSGIPMQVLLEGRSDAFRRSFFGTHFFNPPRYMHLLELIPTPETDPAAYAAVERFSQRVLGKGIVKAKDAPGFIANRLGVFGMIQAMRLVEEFGLTIDEADTLTGPLIGRAKSATFRTGDLSGLDVIGHVASGLSQATGEDFSLPNWVKANLIEQKRFGDKTQGGFYRKQGKAIETLDVKTGQYGPQQKVESPELAALQKLPLAERLRGAAKLPGKHGDFLRKMFALTSHYALTMTPTLAWDIAAMDRAMEWGYGWEAGPFRVMDMLGLDWTRDNLKAHGLDVPPLLDRAEKTFYRVGSDGEEIVALEGGRGGRFVPAPVIPGRIALSDLAQGGRTLAENKGARLLDLGDGTSWARAGWRGSSSATTTRAPSRPART
jgi:3-hydroxyacyl-CoA dehydrogenase